jgi:type IV secretory pathway TrbD component
MPLQMTYTGRNFDIVTGVSALVLGLVMLKWNVPRVVVWIWNVTGLALLINIVAVAMLSSPLFQFFGSDHLNTFVAYPPYVLLPAVMVLAAWAGHLVVFKALVIRKSRN